MNRTAQYLNALPAKDRQLVERCLARAGEPDCYTRAAQDVGLSAAEGLRRLQSPRVADAYQRCLDELQAPEPGAPEPVIDARYVLSKLVELVEFDLSAFVEVDAAGVVTLDVTEKTAPLLKHLSGIDIDTETVNGVTRRKVRFRAPDKLRALQLLGQHSEVMAFIERHRVETVEADIEEITAGRDRLAAHREAIEGEYTDVSDTD